jgi:hypothetical protein
VRAGSGDPIRRAHLVVGLGFLAIFALTGVYLRRTFPQAYHGDSGVHMMYRAGHIYILFAALLNVTLGVYFHRPAGQAARQRRLRTFGSALLLTTPPLLTVAFFLEPAGGSFGRPLTTLGIFATALGVVAHLVPAPGGR